MSVETDAAASQFRAYGESRGLAYFANWVVPEATQLMRHGVRREAPNVLIGNLPDGLGDGWLAHAGYAANTFHGIEERLFTLAVARAPASINFAVRVLCHDRDLSDETAFNPDADTEVVELDDQSVELESVGFLERYRLSTDHDQDQLRVWQLFSPALIRWLTDSAPENFSFELQEGALCCFVPGVLARADALDELCAATARIMTRVVEMDAAAPSAATPDTRTRAGMVEAELAEHRFDEPPRSVRAAAGAFGLFWPFLSSRAWRLGGEAFFRDYAQSIGFNRAEEAAYRATHLNSYLPGEITHVAAGRLEGIEHDAHLILTTGEGSARVGWMVLVVDLPRNWAFFAFAKVPETATAKREGIDIIGDGRSLIVWKPDNGPKSRSRRALDSFVDSARTLLAAAIEAGRPGR